MSAASDALRTLADIEAFEATPLASRLAGIHSTYDVLVRAAQRRPQDTALVLLDEAAPHAPVVAVSYGQLLTRVTQAANLFHSLGVGPGDVVSYLLPNLPQTHYTIWGAAASGIANAVNPLLEVEQIAGIMNVAASKLIVTLGPAHGKEIWDKVQAVLPLVPSVQTVLQVMEGDGPLCFDSLLEQQPGDRLVSGRIIHESDIAAYFHTGGTTGTPKLAQHTHANEVADAFLGRWLMGLAAADTVLVGLPLYHVNSVILTGLGSFIAGARVVLLGSNGYRNKSVLQNFWNIVEKYQANYFVGVPTIYAMLLGVPIAGADVSSLRYALCGAAPLPVELMRKFEAASGLKILEGYGLTEGTCISAQNPRDGERRSGSIGLRIPYQQMKAVKLDADGKHLADCQVGEIGSIVIRGPNVFPGYKQQEANAKILTGDGWLDTGDLGRQDGDGYFWLTGRLKELIIRGGHNIDPAIIEEAMSRHPAAHMVAAVGQPDAYAGELPVAFVVLKAGAAASAQELLEHARATVPERAAVPVEIYIVDALPLTGVGKIFKPQLRYEATKRLLERILREACAGLATVDVAVGPDKVHGMSATIHPVLLDPVGNAQVEARMAAALGNLGVRYRIVWPPQPRR